MNSPTPPSNTPETDANILSVFSHPHLEYVNSDFARKLERERNEARQLLLAHLAGNVLKDDLECNKLHTELREAKELEKACAEVFNLRPINGMTVAETLRGIVKDRDSLQSQLTETQSEVIQMGYIIAGLKEQLTEANQHLADNKTTNTTVALQVYELTSQVSELRKDKERLSLEEKPCGDIWLHVKNGDKECQASINLGQHRTNQGNTIVGRALRTAIQSGKGTQ